MASETGEKLNGKLQVDNTQPNTTDLEVNKKLKDSGLEYVSRNGKTVAAKVQPEELCKCPLRCGDKIPDEVRKYLFTEFYKMGDHIQQNNYLQKHIEMRSVSKRLWDDKEHRVDGRLQRRVSCKYQIPIEIPKDENSSGVKTEKDKHQTSTKKATTKHKVSTAEVCQKAFMNTYAISEKRIRLQREKLITKSRKDAGIQPVYLKDSSQIWKHDLIAELGPLLMNREILANISSFENLSAMPSDVPTKILQAIDNDISVVNNFFCNQLWKPEYISCDLDKSLSASENNEYYRNILMQNRQANTNGDSGLVANMNTSKTVSSTDKPLSTSTPKNATTTSVLSSKLNKKPSNFTNSRIDETPPKPSVSAKPETKYMSFENSSISITPVSSKGTPNSTSSSIYNSINFGNSSISITPLYRQ